VDALEQAMMGPLRNHPRWLHTASMRMSLSTLRACQAVALASRRPISSSRPGLADDKCR
jgi:hypothetical protein